MNKAKIYSPEVVKDEDTVIVTTNHLGASMEALGRKPLGEAGRDAQCLADISGQIVIGLDRPQSGDGQHYSSVQAHMMRTEPALVLKCWINRLRPSLAETGARRVELVGRSIAANFLMEVAVLEELPVVGIVAVDPFALRKTTRAQAASHYLRGALPSSPAKVRRHILDIRQNRQYMTSDKANLTAALIAARMKSTKTLFAFADMQKPADHEDLEQTIHSLNTLRSKRNGVAPLLAEFVAGTTHNAFNKPEVYAAQYERYRELGRTGDVFTQKIETIQTDLL